MAPRPRALSATERDALEELEALDARLDAEGVVRLTLDPRRARASRLAAIGGALLPRARALGAEAIFVEGLARTVGAVRAHFPENLFWDLDELAASALREAAEARDPPTHVAEIFEEVVALSALFGGETAIRFRYAHDLVYGFDWAKWVRRDPAERASVGPFSLPFLRSMRARGHELLALIAADDPKYPRLREGERARNPFVFSREPEDEALLHRDLAERGLIPVRAWAMDEPAVWDRPFAEAREARASALGLSRERRAPQTSRGGGR